MLMCMHSTSVRIDGATHDELKRLASELNTTVGNAVTLAVRAFRQQRIGLDLHAPLGGEEKAWLDADLG
jgi:predicted transcriptional regulator